MLSCITKRITEIRCCYGPRLQRQPLPLRPSRPPRVVAVADLDVSRAEDRCTVARQQAGVTRRPLELLRLGNDLAVDGMGQGGQERCIKVRNEEGRVGAVERQGSHGTPPARRESHRACMRTGGIISQSDAPGVLTAQQAPMRGGAAVQKRAVVQWLEFLSAGPAARISRQWRNSPQTQPA